MNLYIYIYIYLLPPLNVTVRVRSAAPGAWRQWREDACFAGVFVVLCINSINILLLLIIYYLFITYTRYCYAYNRPPKSCREAGASRRLKSLLACRLGVHLSAAPSRPPVFSSAATQYECNRMQTLRKVWVGMPPRSPE